MHRKLIGLISLVLLLSLANIATATPNDWTGTTNTNYMDPTNWNPAGVPTSEATIEEWDEIGLTMTTVTNWPVIDVGSFGSTPVVEKLRVGYHSPIATTPSAAVWVGGEGGSLVVTPQGTNHGYLEIISGTVQVTGDLELGYGDKRDIMDDIDPLILRVNDFSQNDVYGEINMSGGQLIIGDDVRLGRYATGVLNMTGGEFISIDRGEALDLASRGGYYGDSQGIVNISGGVIDINKISVGDGTGDITISGTGMIKLDGNQLAEVLALIVDGTIHGPGGVGYYYDPAMLNPMGTPGMTIIIPEPMTICLLGLGGLFLLRRRR